MISDSNPNPLDDKKKGCGQSLQAARESAGLTIEDVASRLRMPVRVVSSLEQEDWERLGAPVFVKGQLKSYAKLLSVDIDDVLEQAHIAPIEPVKLVSHTHTPRARRVAESLGRKALYVAITVVLAVPAWYATRSHFGVDSGPSTASLDVVPAQTAAALPEQGQASFGDGNKGGAPDSGDNAPYIASLTPMPRGREDARGSLAPDNAKVSASSAAGGLSLRFNGDSWVEIFAPDGSVVEKALIHSGEQRQFEPGQVGRVVLGNASAVEVQQGGRIVDVKPYQRANVARFAVSSDGSVAPLSN